MQEIRDISRSVTSASTLESKSEASRCCPSCPSVGQLLMLILKQGVMTILFFSAFHIGFTGTIFLVYAADSAINERAVLLSYVGIVVTAAILVLLIADFIKTGTSTANYG